MAPEGEKTMRLIPRLVAKRCVQPVKRSEITATGRGEERERNHSRRGCSRRERASMSGRKVNRGRSLVFSAAEVEGKGRTRGEME